MYKFSIIIPTYKSPLKSVLLTIESILRQSFCDYEIIITDDNSNEDNFDIIEGYLLRSNFKKYIFIKNKENIGTVLNLRNAIIKSNGEYIKGIGPGDLLFSNNTLEKLNVFLENKNCNFAFGRLKSYFLEDNKVKYSDFVAPPNNVIYSYENSLSALENMIIKRKYISGSTMIYKKEFILKQKYDLSQSVKYCEDLVQVLVALNKEKIEFFDDNLIWYEYGNGISTNKKTNYKIKEDHINFFKNLNIKYLENRSVNKAYRDAKINIIKNPIKRRALKFFTHPGNFLYKFKKAYDSNNVIELKYEKGFLVEGDKLNFINENNVIK